MDRRVRDILREERALLLAGKVDGLADLMARKDKAIAGRSFSRAVARNIAANLQENDKLMVAALDGLAAARARLDAMAQARSTLRVYGSDGETTDVSTARRNLERKA